MEHIKESDWKYLRKIQKQILNRHCDCILELIELIVQNRKGAEFESFIQIYRAINDKDKEIAETYDDMKRSNAIEKIFFMRKHLAMTDEEFSNFSDETKEFVNRLLSIHDY